jgi:ankyrin repeat protein
MAVSRCGDALGDAGCSGVYGGNAFLSSHTEAAVRAIYDSPGATCLAAQSVDGHTPLHIAAAHPGCVKLLISLGADVNAVNTAGQTPLHISANNGATVSAQLLLDASASVSATSSDGAQPLQNAAAQHLCSLCKLLLERGANVHAVISNGVSVLRYAVCSVESAEDKWYEPALKCVQLLVAAGADVQQYSEKWASLLHACATNRHTAVTQYLLEQLLPQQPDVLSKVDAQGSTALYRAVVCDSASVVKVLLAAGVSVHTDIDLVLHGYINYAGCKCVSSQLLIAEGLLSAGANVMQLDALG